ncbi:MAG: DegV family protein [Candidatus Kariarchaeaceae archaeon]
MSAKVAIVTSTASDFPSEMAKELGVHVVDTYVHFGTDTYRNRDMEIAEFHERVRNSDKKDFPTTSQPSAQDFTEVYERLKNDGYTTIISIHISVKLSGTINSANVAAGMIEGLDIRLVDTHGASFTVTACVLKALDLLEKGKSVDDIVREVTKMGQKIHGFFTLKTMDNLVRGGRVGKVRYRLGKLLNIKPVLRVGSGAITAHDKARGVDASREKMYSHATEGFTKGQKFNYIVAHSRLYDEAEILEKKVKKDFPKSSGFIGEIGISVGVHAGEGALFLLCYK